MAPSLRPQRNAALTAGRRGGGVRGAGHNRFIAQLSQEPTLHVEPLAPGHRFVIHPLHGDVAPRRECVHQRGPCPREAAEDHVRRRPENLSA